MFQPTKAFEDIARGDVGAKEFLEAFYLWCHALDDAVDRDKPPKTDALIWVQTNLIFVLAKNQFFARNRDFLLPVILMSALAYLASEDRKNHADVMERLTAQVLKSEYWNVFFAVAFCVDGFDHALAMSRKYREYEFDVEPAREPGASDLQSQ